jgi:hypothetical protein
MDATAKIDGIKTGIRIDCFMLCDGAQESNGKLYVLGGGWDTLLGQDFPLTIHTFAVALKLAVPWNEANRQRRFRIEVRDPDNNKDILPRPLEGEFNVGRPPTAQPGDDLTVVLAITFNAVVFPKPGTFGFHLLVDNDELATTKLCARKLGQRVGQ